MTIDHPDIKKSINIPESMCFAKIKVNRGVVILPFLSLLTIQEFPEENDHLKRPFRMKYLIILSLILLSCSEIPASKNDPDFLKFSKDQWVDSVMTKLTLEQKIGQLFMIQAYSNKKSEQTEELLELISDYQVGGLIFMQGGPVAQAKICNRLQKASSIPLLVAIDGETGLGFRLDSTISYPVQMALGAISNDSLIYRMGYEIGEQCRMLGIHMNMAPVSDINNNPENPVINSRSFGENKIKVAHKAWLYASGMQAAGILATAKHFPGHGDTQDDSHLGLPVIKQSKIELDSLELFPFSYLIDKGIDAVMTGHLQVPALESDSKIPASLSSKIIRTKLQNEMGFKGLVITDAMNMKGVSNLYSSAESAVKALKAGNDMIEIVPRLDRAIEAVKLAVANGELSIDDINAKCRKILTVKKWLNLDQHKLVETTDLERKLNESRFRLTKRLLQERSLTVLINRNNLLPLKELDTLKIASLEIGSDQTDPFQKMLGNYTSVDHFSLTKTASEVEINNIINQLKPYNLLIIGIKGMGLYPNKRFGITIQQISVMEKLRNRNMVVCFFGNPYALNNFALFNNANALLVAYQDDSDLEEMAAQLIFGATNATGKLPVSTGNFPINSGIEYKSIQRLKYTLPEEVKISSSYLSLKLDSLAELGIKKKAFPGCQVLVAKEGKVIFNKSYGSFTYDNAVPVENSTLYDLASVTKVTAALPAIMKLYDEKKIDLDAPFANYFAEFRKTNKAEMTVRDVLTHQARLQSGIPFWVAPGSTTKLKSGVFRNKPSENYPIRISSGMYERNDFKNQIISDIIKSPLRDKKEFHYSDLGFSLIPFITERLTNEPFQEYLSKDFYKPLGAVSTGFKPFEKYPIQQIAPTENDEAFRKELLQGFVHDETAALLGGVSGNAGLFSNANDLAKVMQMYLQSGYYGGKQYLSPEAVQEFTKVQFPNSENHRALGFDKPNPGISGQKNKFPAEDASPESYGHTGFTGTFVWADPSNQLLFIFLSNRVYPTRRNSGLSDLNTRPKMHQAIYDAIKKGEH
jgi:beta-glucosidase-like glycosyl hydrolase/CubicO group peptidase (beta-lactamase class C family)